jgi:lipopolysaccharide/colanic/teichoic acid biosynthesis glycosyltransferase
MDSQAIPPMTPAPAVASNLLENGDMMLVRDASAVHPPSYASWKVWLEWWIAALLLLPGLPLLGLIMALVRSTSRGPALYRQQRMGKHGQTFTMFKVRTMVTDAEAATGPIWSAKNDPRVTSLGKWLRKLHLDELPQLFNVLNGEMSLMGPRPERPEIARQLATRIPGYGKRLAIRPGITGLAQINLPPDVSLQCVRRKLVLDLQYIHEMGLVLDLRMLLCSMLRVLGIPGEVATGLMRLRRIPEVPPAWLSYCAVGSTPSAQFPIAGQRRGSEPSEDAKQDHAAQLAEIHSAFPTSQ